MPSRRGQKWLRARPSRMALTARSDTCGAGFADDNTQSPTHARMLLGCWMGASGLASTTQLVAAVACLFPTHPHLLTCIPNVSWTPLGYRVKYMYSLEMLTEHVRYILRYIRIHSTRYVYPSRYNPGTCRIHHDTSGYVSDRKPPKNDRKPP